MEGFDGLGGRYGGGRWGLNPDLRSEDRQNNIRMKRQTDRQTLRFDEFRVIDRFRFIAIWKIHYKDANISLRTYKRIVNLTKCKRIEDSTKYCFLLNPDSLL